MHKEKSEEKPSVVPIRPDTPGLNEVGDTPAVDMESRFAALEQRVADLEKLSTKFRR